MTPQSEDNQTQELIEAAYRQTLATFEQEVARGERDPLAEITIYRRRRRDYESLLRIGQLPDEARELAQRLLETHGLAPASRQEFETEVARLLVRLYAAFIDCAERKGSDSTQGNK
ncbi:MAG TPA: hypothetical protein VF275_04935 [Gammaproteobacteria bacterium]